MRWLIAMVVAPLLVVILGAGFASEQPTPTSVDVDPQALPPLAQDLLPVMRQELAACPDLPLVWLVAEIQAESSWDPNAYSPAGAAGLAQFLPGTWTDAGGGAGWTTKPAATHPVWDPQTHLHVAVEWMCANLHLVTDHLTATGKPTAPLQAMAVCHIAGCSRVTGSATGIPTAGEAGCGTDCVTQIRAYLAAIDRWIQAYAPPVTITPGPGGTAAAYPGGPTGCAHTDPTGTGGCLTGATLWMLTQTLTVFPGVPVSCWDAHAWNPTSDHPKGRACDFTIGSIGRFPDDAATAHGWVIADWLRANATSLNLTYIIWQGRIWGAGRADQGWRVYTGGGIYNPTDPTGGHYDHIHVSVAL